MPVYVSTTFMQNQSSVIKAVSLLTEKNIFNIELGSIHCCERRLGPLLKEIRCSYIVHNFFPPLSERIILNIASCNDQIRRKSLEFIKYSIDFAEAIGAKIYTIHPGFLVDPIGEARSSKNYDFDFSLPDSSVPLPDYMQCFNIFLDSLKEIARYINVSAFTVAVETQGSVSNKDFVLFSKPDDFFIFLKEVQDRKIGINLNLGHLNLAAYAWSFDKYRVIEMLKPRIVAVELSHNEGLEDDHEALRSDGWYMEVLRDNFFKDIPVIFEGRHLDIDKVVQSYQFLQDTLKYKEQY